VRRSPQILAVAHGDGIFFCPNEYLSKPWKQDRGVTSPSGPNVEASARTISVVLCLSSVEAALPIQIDG
jgi:hypothetical protein